MGLQTKTFTIAGQTFTAGTFTSITQLLGSATNLNVPEGYSKLVRISMSFAPDVAEATDGCSVFKFAGDGVVVQQLIAGPAWCNQGVASLNGNNGMPVVMEAASGVFEINAGNQIDLSVSVTTDAVADVAISLTFSA